MSDEIVTQIMRNKSQMESDRSPHEQTWRDCFDLSFPERGSGFYGQQDDAAALQAKRAKLLDSTATESGLTLASAIMGGGTPSNSRWFGLGTGQDSDDEKDWFDDSAETIFSNIHASNYDAVGFDGALDMVAAGWFVMMIDVDRDEGGYHFELWPMATCYIAASKAGGLPDTLVRTYRLSAIQAVKEFGQDAVSEKIRKAIDDGKGETKFTFCVSIYPRPKDDAGGVRAKNLPFASCHIEVDSKRLVRESGYHECPFVAPRWAKLPESDYAVGPMFRALPDSKQVNYLMGLENSAAELAVAGMWIAEDDGVLNPRTVKVGPRKIIIANSVDSMKELKNGSDFNVSFTKKADLQNAMRRILMADQLSPQDSPVRTATEIHVRVQMIRQLLGPIYGRMQDEWYKPMIARCFGLAMRAGILRPPPQSLANRNFSVKFESPNAKAQKLEEVMAVEASLVTIGQIAAATQDVSIWDTIDLDQAITVILEGRGAPARVGRNKDDIAAMREQRAKAQQQAQQQQQQAAMAEKMAPQMAKNMAPA